MLRDLDYQARVLTVVDDYLAHLIDDKKRADRVQKLVMQDPDLGIDIPDHAERAWDALRQAGRLPVARANIPFSPRKDGVGRSVPNVVLKVPTGGGKTYLATASLSRIMGRYLGKNSGFVLWIVPNEAIYTQTLKQLKDREHPYRQMLDRSAMGRVKIMEKNDPLNSRDVDSHLCVMVLMLQAANRETKDSLKMFQDRGDVHGFFPPEGDQAAHQAALDATPNLDAYSAAAGSGSMWPMVKDSLGNALRLIRPVVVMDEGHRAISDLAFRTLYGFNPAFVLELTATPVDVAARGGRNPREARYANVLVDVLGVELLREGMIKMPLNLATLQDADWHNTLNTALNKLDELQETASDHRANGGNYIRPIMLVQVERTGEDQRDGNHIHALDVKDWLAQAGLDPDAEIAIKTADVNDLNNPENQDLLAPTNRVRVIITKQALQEGWDNPFAYVLCSLAASSSLNSMTQLVGRILRQPHAEKTNVEALDECYVYAHHASTADVVQAVKAGLEDGGLGDLVREVRQEDETGSTTRGPRNIPRRNEFRTTEIYLPQVLKMESNQARLLDYDTDILYQLDWTDLNVQPLVARIPTNFQAAESQLQRITLTEGEERITAERVEANKTVHALDPSYLVRLTSDIVQNAWIARDIVGRLLDGLRTCGFTDERLGQLSSLILSELRKYLAEKRDEKAEQLFRHEVSCGNVQFRLRADGANWLMPTTTVTTEPENAPQLIGLDGGPLKKSLFSPHYGADFNSDERDVAVYLDAEETLNWWHRNVARNQYYLQGWRRGRIYPDFIFAARPDGTANRITVLETKGDHLGGNDDTTYKAAVLGLLSGAFQWDKTVPAGQMELLTEDGTTVQCELVLMDDWQTRLPGLIASTPGPTPEASPQN